MLAGESLLHPDLVAGTQYWLAVVVDTLDAPGVDWLIGASYSGDGSRIAFLSDRTGYAEIWVAGADGRNPQQWTFLKTPGLGSPRWSPDGRRIAFTMPGRDGSAAYWIDGPNISPRLVPDSSRCGYLAWSADGRFLYFGSNRGGTTQIWRVALEAGPAVQVTQGGGRVPAASRDGRSLFYLRLAGDAGENHLFRKPLGDGPEEKVLESVDAYSLTGSGIASKFYRPGPRPEGPHLEFFRFTGAITRLAKTDKPLRYGIAVSPDGRYLLYSQVDYEVSDLMLVDDLR